MAILEIFNAGGPVMWALLLCSIIAVTIVIERAWSLRKGKVLDPAIVERIQGLVEGGDRSKAIQVAKQNPGHFSNVVLFGFEQASRGEQAAREAIEDAGRHEASKLNRYLNTLGTIVGISPLLGLFGTVTGMIEVFRTIAQAGTGQAAELSNGISQALITTATGLLVAIPSLVAYNFFQGKARELIGELERASLRILRTLFPGSLDMMHPGPSVTITPTGNPAQDPE